MGWRDDLRVKSSCTLVPDGPDQAGVPRRSSARPGGLAALIFDVGSYAASGMNHVPCYDDGRDGGLPRSEFQPRGRLAAHRSIMSHVTRQPWQIIPVIYTALAAGRIPVSSSFVAAAALVVTPCSAVAGSRGGRAERLDKPFVSDGEKMEAELGTRLRKVR